MLNALNQTTISLIGVRHYATFQTSPTLTNISSIILYRWGLICVYFKSPTITRITATTLLASSLIAGLTACDNNTEISTTSINGTVFAAPVDGASCEIQDNTGTTIVGPVVTLSDGTYSIDIPDTNLGDDLMLVCNGGTYTDEADGTTQTAGTMSAYAAANSLGADIGLHVTPDSTIVQQLVRQHGMTLTEAHTTFKNNFGYTPDTTIKPTDATNPDSDATDDQLLAGLHAAAFSQMTSDLGLTPGQQFTLLPALADDLSDGTLDGIDTNGTVNVDGDSTLPLPVNIQNQFSVSMLNFHNDDTKNMTGLNSASIGTQPFAKTTITDSYKVEYVPGMMDAMEGKTQFKIRLTDLANDQAATGKSVTLMPMMHMATMNHSTPVDGACIEDSNTAGTYNCTIYYLMASAMMDGTSMGYWDLKVLIGGMMGEAANFYPPVMMAMGDTPRVRLKGLTDVDMMMGMTGSSNREYNLFKSSLSGMTGNHDFEIFVTAKESMMSFPAVYVDAIIDQDSTMYELTISSMNIEVTTDLSDENSWITADGSSNDGYWKATGLTGLTDGTEGSIYVRMTINGNQYSTDGSMANGINAYTTFTVTPKSM